MRKIYILVLSVLSCQFAVAQLSLTKAFNEPVIGDVDTKQGFDSTGTLPKATGSGMVWNFTGITANTVVAMSTYTTVASTPSASSYPSATIAEDAGAGTFNYYSASATQYALLGSIDASGLYVNFSPNSAVIATWPINFGYNATDLFNGNVSVAGLSGTAAGTMNLMGSGTGTLMLPGGLNFTNVLQVKLTQTITLNLAGGFVTGTITATDYQYYHASQKFPILDLNYQNTNIGGSPTDSYDLLVNNNVLTAISNVSFNASNFSFYPNPASERLTVILANEESEQVSAEILNQLGQIVSTTDLGNAKAINQSIDLTGLTSGIYFIKTTVGEKTTVKKLIVK
jgi:hypothetical protein